MSDEFRPTFIDALTGIRAVAALWVLLAHFSPTLIDDFNFPEQSILQPLFDSAYAGVDLFFVLSGFILAHTYLGSFEAFKLRASWRFWWKRFARIYPVYILTTLLSMAMLMIANAVGYKFTDVNGSVVKDPVTLILNVMGIQEWLGVDSINGPAWSVSAEFFAYAIFPVIAMLALRSHSRVFLVMVILVLTFALVPMYRQGVLPPRIWQIICEFLTGVATYKLARSWPSVTEWVARPRVRAAMWCGALAIVYVGGVMSTEAHFALSPLFAMIIWSYSNSSGRGALLETKIVVRLGLWSYSLYLIHRIVQGVASGLHLTSTGVPVLDGAIFVALIATAIILSGITYHFFEEPARRFLSQRPYFGLREIAG